MYNTPTHTAIRYIVFKEEGTWYAVALDLGIVFDGETPDGTLINLFKAIDDLIELQSEPQFEGKSFHVPEIDPEYEAMWNQAVAGDRLIESPYQIYTTGLRQVA